jgi:site-specific recombinase XerD
MHRALETVAGILSDTLAEYRGGMIYKADPLSIPWGEMRFQHASLIKSVLSESYTPAGANKILSALRGVLRAAFNLGQMSAEDYQRAIQVKAIRGETLPAGRSITPGELQALIDVCSHDLGAAGARDTAIVAILYSCGLRRAELAGLDLADYDRIEGTLRVRGKGRKERLAHVVNGAARALADWLTVRGIDPGPLFLPIRKGGHVTRGRLTTQAVYHILQTRADQAGVKSLSPHDFRRTFVGDLLDAGADISTVQRLAGHANVTTTARYDRRPEAAKRKAVELLHVPYRGRRSYSVGEGGKR